MKKQFEGVTAITCKDGITTVEFEKEVNQQAEEETKGWPQPGDFVAVDNANGSQIGLFINKGLRSKIPLHFDYHFSIFPDGSSDLDSPSCCLVHIGDDEIIRPATPSEQKMLEDALLKVGKVWNPDTQKIERWRATLDEPYKLIGSDGKTPSKTDTLLLYDNRHFDIGNYFHPSEDTSRYEKAYRDIFKDRLI